MDSAEMIVLTVVVIALLACSAFFSGTETAYMSVSKTRLKSLADEGNARAKRALENTKDFDRLLTTVLVGNNIVNTASSTITTALLTEILGPTDGVIVATVLMITVLLICGEITPKTIAKRRPDSVAMRFAGAIHWVLVILAPITWVFLKVTNGISRAAGSKAEKEPTMTEKELSVMIDEIQQEGTLEKGESELIKSAMNFDDVRVAEIIVPRVDVVAVRVSTTVEDMRDVFAKSEFSRIPVYEGSVDHIIGAVFIKDFFMKYTSGKKFRITDIIRPVKFVSANASIAAVMNELQRAKLNMAVVLDEFGGTLGIVTMEDLLEELVGDIWDESDIVKYPIIKEKDGTYTVLGDANIYDIMEKVGRSFEDPGYDSSTVAGYISYRLKKIPQVGDEVVYRDVRLKVKGMRNRRVREVALSIDPSLIAPPEDEDSDAPERESR